LRRGRALREAVLGELLEPRCRIGLTASEHRGRAADDLVLHALGDRVAQHVAGRKVVAEDERLLALAPELDHAVDGCRDLWMRLAGAAGVGERTPDRIEIPAGV